MKPKQTASRIWLPKTGKYYMLNHLKSGLLAMVAVSAFSGAGAAAADSQSNANNQTEYLIVQAAMNPACGPAWLAYQNALPTYRRLTAKMAELDREETAIQDKLRIYRKQLDQEKEKYNKMNTIQKINYTPTHVKNKNEINKHIAYFTGKLTYVRSKSVSTSIPTRAAKIAVLTPVKVLCKSQCSSMLQGVPDALLQLASCLPNVRN